MKGARIIASLLLSLLLIGGAFLTVQQNQETDGLITFAYAQEDEGNFFFPDAKEGFVPCGKRGEGNVIIDEPCTICHAGEMGQNIINFIMRTIVPVLAILIAAWGGFEILTAGGNENKYKSGRSRLIKVVVGVLIVLLAWAAVNFFLYTFFKDDVIGKWNQFDCSVEGTGPVTGLVPVDFIVESAPTFPTDGTITPGTGNFGATLSESSALSQLSAAGINFVRVCSTGSLNGIRQAAIDEVVWLKQNCNCPVTVTEGTGQGCHSTNSPHYVGVKIDIDDTPAVTQFILQNADFKYRRTGSFAADIYQFPGRAAAYAKESTHWDIQVR